MMALLIFLALVAVVGAKYYTAVGQRNLERRLMRTRKDLDDARQVLKGAKEKRSQVGENEELVLQRIQSLKEKIEDMNIQLTTSSEEADRIATKDESPRPMPDPSLFK